MQTKVAIVLFVIAGFVGSAGAAFAKECSTGDDGGSALVVLLGEVTSVSNGHVDIIADQYGIVFANRPGRTVRHIDAATLVDAGWGEDGFFLSDPPNASLVGTNETVAIVEIKTAFWSDGILQLDFVLLEGDLPSSDDRVAFTIDDVLMCCAEYTCDCGN